MKNFEHVRSTPDTDTASNEAVAAAVLGVSEGAVSGPTPHWGAGPDSKDTAPKAIDNQVVQKALKAAHEVFKKAVTASNGRFTLESLTTIRRTGGFIIEVTVKTIEGNLVEVPLKIEDQYTLEDIETKIAQCLISTSIRTAMRGGIRINTDFYTLFSYEVESTSEGNKATLLLAGDGGYYQVELPIQESFSRDDIETEIIETFEKAKKSDETATQQPLQ